MLSMSITSLVIAGKRTGQGEALVPVGGGAALLLLLVPERPPAVQAVVACGRRQKQHICGGDVAAETRTVRRQTIH